MEENELRALIVDGEGPSLEFKREFTTQMVRDMVAFANSSGGLLIVGVDDDASLAGVDEEPLRVEERIQSLCRANCKPALSVAVRFAKLDDAQLVLVDVPEASGIVTANDVCYVRAGSTTRRALPEELQSLALKAAPTAFEQTPVAGLTFDDLDVEKMADHFEQRAPGAVEANGIRLERLAANQHFVVRANGDLVPTAAGALLFSQRPQAGQPHWGMAAIKVSGDRLSDPIADRQDIEGTLPEMARQAEAFVRRNMRVAAEIDDAEGHVKRREIPEYPLAAVREVIVNSLAHRDYSVATRTALRIFDDRLEVANPGGLATSLDLDELLKEGGRSFARNPVIVGVMREWREMEDVGRGLLMIQREMRDLGSPPPEFDVTQSTFAVRLPSRHGT